jgi:hypothetical protein
LQKKLTIEQRLAALSLAPQSAEQQASLDLGKILFDKQYEALSDPSPFKVLICSRRAGKSTGIAAKMVKDASEAPKDLPGTELYVTGSRTDAKKIVWSEIKRLSKEKGLNGVPNESELVMHFPNGSLIRLAGAKDKASIDKIRGQMPPVRNAYIDEAQLIRDEIMEELVDDVIEPALLDYAGTLTLAGTPGTIPAGYFYDAIHGKDGEESTWKVFRWTYWDNPWISKKSGKTHQWLLDRILKRRGLVMTSPAIRREYFGEFVTDLDSRVYQYDGVRDHYLELPNHQYTYILGIDLGFNDADALAVLAWSDNSKVTYLVEEVVTREQGITELVEQIEKIRKKYPISKIVMDTGGLGKKISEEIIRRYRIPIQPAEKVRKFEYIELFNAAMRTGQFKAKGNSLFAEDSLKVEWDYDKTKPDKKVISDRFHSDICEAVLYAWRESYSFTFTPAKPKPKYGTTEWADELEEKLEEAAFEHFSALEEASKDPYG